MDFVFTQVLGYLAYTLALAALVTGAIDFLKPIVLDSIKSQLTENVWLIVILAIRAVLTGIGYFALWGGVEATKAILSSLPVVIPDIGIAAVTIGLIVAGEEVIYKLTWLVEAAKEALLRLGNRPPVELPSEGSGSPTPQPMG